MEAIWIIGSSLMFWLNDYIQKTRQRIKNTNTIIHGRSGGKWNHLHQILTNFHGQKPKYIIIHLGGNNIGNTPIGKLIYQIKTDLTLLSQQYGSTRIVWSDILPRRYWSEARGKKAQAKMEGLRKRLNRSIHKHMTEIDGHTIRHDNIKYEDHEYFKHDGTHLSAKGNQRLLDNISNFIKEKL